MSASKFFRNFLTLPQVGVKDNSCQQTRDKELENHDQKLQRAQGLSFPAPDVECKGEFEFPVNIDHGSHQHQKKISDDAPTTDLNQTLNHENGIQNLQLKFHQTEDSSFPVPDVECKREFEFPVNIDHGFDQHQKKVFDDVRTTDLNKTLNHENGIQDLQLNLHVVATATAKDIDRSCFDTEENRREQVDTVTNNGTTYSSAIDKEIKNESISEYVINSLYNSEIHTEVVCPVEFTNLQTTADGSLKDEKTEEKVMAPTDDMFDKLFQDCTNTLPVATKTNDREVAISDDECGSIASSTNTEIYGELDCQDIEEHTHIEETLEDVVRTGPTDYVQSPDAHFQFPSQVNNLPFQLEGNQYGSNDYASIAMKKKRISVAPGIMYDDEVSSPVGSNSSVITQPLLPLNHSREAEEVPSSSSSALHGNNSHGMSSSFLSLTDALISKVPPYAPVARHIIQQHDERQLFSCEFCGKRCGDRFHLSQHLTNSHSLEQPFFCYHCGMRFKLLSDLSHHKLTHAEESHNFSCYICKKLFKTRDDLVSHGDIHKEVEFSNGIVCNICKMVLRNPSAWELHMMSHSCKKSLTSEQEMEVSSVESSQCSIPTLTLLSSDHSFNGQANYVGVSADVRFQFPSQVKSSSNNTTQEISTQQLVSFLTKSTAPVDQQSVNSSHVKINKLPIQVEDSQVQNAFSLALESCRSKATKSDSQLSCSMSELQRLSQNAYNQIVPVSKVSELRISNAAKTKSNQSQDTCSQLVSLLNGSSDNTHNKVVSVSKPAIVGERQISNATKKNNQIGGSGNSSKSMNRKRISVANEASQSSNIIKTLPSTMIKAFPSTMVKTFPSTCHSLVARAVPPSSSFPSFSNHGASSSILNLAPQPIVLFMLPPGATIVSNPGIVLAQNKEGPFATQALLPFHHSERNTNIPSSSSLRGIGGPHNIPSSSSILNYTNPLKLPKLLPRAPLVSDRGICAIKDMGRPQTCASCGKTYNKTNSIFFNGIQQNDKGQNFSSECCDQCRIKLPPSKENCPFPCGYCNKSFKTRDELVSHGKLHNYEEYRKSIVCSICKRVFQNPYQLQQHMVIHAGEISSSSSQVIEVSSDEDSQCSTTTQTLLHSVGSEVASVISQNNQGTSSKFHFNKDPPVTSNLPPGATLLNSRGVYGIKDKERPFACGFCGKTYKGKHAVYSHIVLQHDEKHYSCEFCGKRFAEPCLLATHVTIHTQEKPFTCDLCGKQFRLRGSLRNHRYTHSEERHFACKICSKLFKTTNVLSRHMESHNKDGPKKRVTCNICKKKYRSPSDLKQHMMVHTGEKPFKCSLCDKQFRMKPQLDIHMNSHSGKKRLAPCCTVCGKTVWESYMPTHMRMHSGEKPFECNVCGKRFPKKMNLEGHMRSHTGEKPFACSGCDKRFALYSNMMTHKAKCTKISENVG